MEWQLGHCWDILKDAPTVDYTPESEKRANKLRVRQVETRARMARRARQREREVAAKAFAEMEDGPIPPL